MISHAPSEIFVVIDTGAPSLLAINLSSSTKYSVGPVSRGTAYGDVRIIENVKIRSIDNTPRRILWIVLWYERLSVRALSWLVGSVWSSSPLNIEETPATIFAEHVGIPNWFPRLEQQT